MSAFLCCRWVGSVGVASALSALFFLAWSSSATPARDVVNRRTVQGGDSRAVAAEVDRLIVEELARAGVEPAPATNDADFLRRVTLDLTGTIPSASDVTLFALDPDPDKRAKLIERLLHSEDFAENWARYWRDVIYMRATEQRSRLGQGAFETWMGAQLKENVSWDQVVTSLLTATGDVRENGATALMFAHGGQAEEIAAETSRIFLGIQIQCANCHDHPTEKWKRRHFHELAAFFPRVSVRRKASPAEEMEAMKAREAEASARNSRTKRLNNTQPRSPSAKRPANSPDGVRRQLQAPLSFEVVSFVPRANNAREEFFMSPERAIRRLDRNGDKMLSREELQRTPAARVFDRLLEQADENKDQKLSADEIKKVRPPDNPGRGSAEHRMPDPNDPASPGQQINPSFFVNGASPKKNLDDVERRAMLARYITSRQNVWFSRAYVNRIWGELFGAAFYLPIDDIGPERTPVFPQVLEVLSRGFVESGYDVRWLFRTITNTAAYQRQAVADTDPANGLQGFAAAIPKRLRADQIYGSIVTIAGGGELPEGLRQRGDRRQGLLRSPRGQFGQLFGFDPSTPQDEVIGTVPQALFLMNSPAVNRLVEGPKLKQILDENPQDADAVNELYLLVLGRTAAPGEVKTCVDYRAEVGNRAEAFEDLFWALLNSSEFLSHR